mmetsp:Transcript_59653/g.69716  ORF Transcript_59653/g.69716 Transcript_59653/m.69716 type:complete len:543 (-) Transcript_59653:56-1684(-)
MMEAIDDPLYLPPDEEIVDGTIFDCSYSARGTEVKRVNPLTSNSDPDDGDENYLVRKKSSGTSTRSRDAKKSIKKRNDLKYIMENKMIVTKLKILGLKLTDSKNKFVGYVTSPGMTFGKMMIIFLASCVFASIVLDYADSSSSLTNIKTSDETEKVNIDTGNEAMRLRQEVFRVNDKLSRLKDEMNNPSSGDKKMAAMIDQINGMQNGMKNQIDALQQLKEQNQMFVEEQVRVTHVNKEVKTDTQKSELPPFNKAIYFPDVKVPKFDPPLNMLRFVTDLPTSSTDVIFLWTVPRTENGLVQGIFDNCFHKVKASKVQEKESLEIFELEGNAKVVNIDISNPSSIANAKSLGLVESGLVEIIVSFYFWEASSLFTPARGGRAIAFLRHPIDRSISMYHHLRKVSPDVESMSLLEYAESSFCEENWMTQHLSNSFSGPLTNAHVNMATTVLRDKVILGFVDKMSISMQNIVRYLDLNEMNEDNCVQKYIEENTDIDDFPHVDEGSKEYDALYSRNELDIKLFKIAEGIFNAQRGLLGLKQLAQQ